MLYNPGRYPQSNESAVLENRIDVRHFVDGGGPAKPDRFEVQEGRDMQYCLFVAMVSQFDASEVCNMAA